MGGTYEPLSDATVTDVWGIMWMRYIAAMGLTILIYDYVLTIADEIRLVWPGPASLPKWLYFINRYLTLFPVIFTNYQIAGFHGPFPPEFCHAWVWTTGVVYVTRGTAGIGILCLRVAALYKDVRLVVWSVWIAFAVFHGTRVVVAFLGMAHVAPGAEYSPLTRLCLTMHTTKKINPKTLAYLATAMPMTLDLLLLVLTFIKGFRNAALSRMYPSSPIMRALLRHELLYFVIIVAIRSTSGVSFIVLPNFLMTMVTNAEWGVESAIISRFFLNLRAVSRSRESTAVSQTAVSAIQTHPLWRRPRRLATGFTFGFGGETSIFGRLTTRHERDIPQTKSVDMDVGMELGTRHDEDKDDVKLGVDTITMEETSQWRRQSLLKSQSSTESTNAKSS